MQPVYVTAVGTGTPAREKDWIKISGDYYQTKPFWSPDGDLLYYFSTQDSFDCLYARRLDSVTKRPLADAFAVRHFHEDLRPPAGSFTGYGLAADRLYLTLATGRSNVWLAEPEKR
jgi:Tol biopolymer transport system component